MNDFLCLWLFNSLLVSAFLSNLRLELTNLLHYPWMKGSMLPESWGSQLLWVAYLQWVHGLRFPEKTAACQSFGPSQLQGLSWELRRWSKQTNKRYNVRGFRLSSSPNEVKFIDRDPHWYSRRITGAIQIRLNPNNINRDSAMKRGCVRSDITTADRYHRPLRERFPPWMENPPTMSEVRDKPITSNHGGTNSSTQWFYTIAWWRPAVHGRNVAKNDKW